MSEETLVQKQVRLVLEQQTHDVAEKLKAMVPAGVGFTLFLVDYGEKGNLAYVSSADREDMIKNIEEWLERQGRTRTPVTNRIQASTLRDVADALSKVVEAIANPKNDPGTTLRNIIAHLRRDADKLDGAKTLVVKGRGGS